MITENLPKHIAIIMDGNGRWAKLKNKQRSFGHIEGANTLKRIVKYANNIGIKYLSVFAFSTENWNRPKIEINGLMKLFILFCKNEINNLKDKNIRLQFIGNLINLPNDVYEILNKTQEELKSNDGLILNVYINYSGKYDILNAVKEINDLNIETKNIDYNLIEKYLLTKDIPDPDLLIRTSGEYRISNYLLWQIAYTELIFVDTLWPDFDEKTLDYCIKEYNKRDRRYGRINE